MFQDVGFWGNIHGTPGHQHDFNGNTMDISGTSYSPKSVSCAAPEVPPSLWQQKLWWASCPDQAEILEAVEAQNWSKFCGFMKPISAGWILLNLQFSIDSNPIHSQWKTCRSIFTRQHVLHWGLIDLWRSPCKYIYIYVYIYIYIYWFHPKFN